MFRMQAVVRPVARPWRDDDDIAVVIVIAVIPRIVIPGTIIGMAGDVRGSAVAAFTAGDHAEQE
jgi:hypothetical protein